MEFCILVHREFSLWLSWLMPSLGSVFLLMRLLGCPLCYRGIKVLQQCGETCYFWAPLPQCFRSSSESAIVVTDTAIAVDFSTFLKCLRQLDGDFKLRKKIFISLLQNSQRTVSACRQCRNEQYWLCYKLQVLCLESATLRWLCGIFFFLSHVDLHINTFRQCLWRIGRVMN